MILELQFKIKENEKYQKYLKEHSDWYKYLNRDPSNFDRFIEEVKDTYLLRTSDRIEHALQTIELMQSVMSTLK